MLLTALSTFQLPELLQLTLMFKNSSTLDLSKLIPRDNTQTVHLMVLCLQGLLQLALTFKNSSKLGLAELGVGDNRIGGVAGQCFLRSLQAYAATAAAGMFVDTKNCSTGTLEP